MNSHFKFCLTCSKSDPRVENLRIYQMPNMWMSGVLTVQGAKNKAKPDLEL